MLWVALVVARLFEASAAGVAFVRLFQDLKMEIDIG
jgi:hypothetical protein